MLAYFAQLLCLIELPADGLPMSPSPDAVRVLLDPNALSPDGTTAITEFEPDPEGARVVYALSHRGSDRQELQILDVDSGRLLPDRIQWVKFASIAWTRDGFFYTRFPEPGSVPPEHAQYFCRVTAMFRHHFVADIPVEIKTVRGFLHRFEITQRVGVHAQSHAQDFAVKIGESCEDLRPSSVAST